MKRTILLTILAIGIIIPLFSQVLFDFDINIQTKIKNGNVVGDVEVILKTDNGKVNYQIMPIGNENGNPIDESGFTKRKRYKFKDFPSGKYLMKISNEKDQMALKYFEIKQE